MPVPRCRSGGIKAPGPKRNRRAEAGRARLSARRRRADRGVVQHVADRHGAGAQIDPKYASIMMLIIDSDKDYRLHEQ